MGLFTRHRPAADPWSWQPASPEILTTPASQFDEQGHAGTTAWGAVFGLAEVPDAKIVIWSFAVYAPPDLGGYQVGMCAQYLLGEEEITVSYDYEALDYADLGDCEDTCRENADLLAGTPRTGPSFDDLMFFDWDGARF